eukprot:7464561-Pyramimonas_sp.AAC.3
MSNLSTITAGPRWMGMASLELTSWLCCAGEADTIAVEDVVNGVHATAMCADAVSKCGCVSYGMFCRRGRQRKLGIT